MKIVLDFIITDYRHLKVMKKVEAKEDFDQIMTKPILHDDIKYYFWGGCFIWSYKDNK